MALRLFSLTPIPRPLPFLLSPPPASSAGRRLVAARFSSRSNIQLLKSSNRSRRSSDVSDDFDDEDEIDEEEDEDDERDGDLSHLEYPGILHTNLPRGSSKRSGGQTLLLKKEWEGKQPKTHDRTRLQDMLTLYESPEKSNSPHSRNKADKSSNELMDLDNEAKLKNENLSGSRFQKLHEDLEFDDKWLPLIDYLCTFGLKESNFISIYKRRVTCLQISRASAEERLEFLLSVGVKSKDMKRILVRQPQILEYTVSNLKSHVTFLVNIGVPNARIGQIISAAPSLFSYSVDQSLKPTVRYLIEEVGIKESDVGKIVQLSPQILVERIDNAWKSRFCFLSRELRAPRCSIVKMVTKHPQLLHYSIEEGILPRIDFLRSIGLENSDILKVLTSLTQVLSLSLEENLKPKYLYLVNELQNEVQSLTKYPMYLSLSLEQRIRPRHCFLVSLKEAPQGPFPLSSFMPTDECFCQQWAGTSLETYHAFRQRLLLTDFTEEYENKSLTSRR